MSYLVTHYLVLEMCKICFEHIPNLASIYKFYILLFVLCVTLPVFNWVLKKDRYRWMIGN